MDIAQPSTLLGGLTPSRFMSRHWQKKPLLVRQAIPGFQPVLAARELFELAGHSDVESRVVQRDGAAWRLQRGPFARRALPSTKRPDWTLLVQGVDLHVPAAHALLHGFSFLPAARLDDLMISYATDGGGVGPHFDSYDVFLLQAQGRRRWRIGRQRDFTLQEGVPLKILARFEPEEEYVLEPGDMLYLPPRWAHDGIAEGECQTYSIGFRAPAQAELARELLQRIADEAAEGEGEPRLYRDPAQPATASPGAIPEGISDFARNALAAALKDPHALDRALGEYLTEPKPNVWFEPASAPRRLRSVVLDPRTRMLHDRRHVFINGEAWRAAGRDAALMRRLADRRRLDAQDLEGASEAARDLLLSWCEAGWLQANGGAP
ncbi:cupin domain-containing protein [Ramlibacter sp. USB13]|uniref:Cupin domain-containing protein n=1 Tax=Ramlibacter cellulosilyticus TaxID=2764187 RepID=A0A923MPE7_9BURK|nr:cupin domain-containing protein [Ramlibacter cellulosilyticus]MBC5782418.1 cupin domain-containing protein [Ramlibacter cellulosilyticus]